MNIFNSTFAKKSLSYLLNKGKIKFLPYVYKSLPLNWTDHKGSNLYHFAAKHQNEYLFELAIFNQANINQYDNRGNAPLHRFIEACFVINDRYHQKYVQEKSQENIIFEINLTLLKEFISRGADVNLWIKKEKKIGWGDNVATYSRNNIRGSAIELLIALFWDNIADSPTFKDKEILKRYYETYSVLSEAGANINLIVDKGEFFNLSNETSIDAMQMTDDVIVSHFFVKYVTNENDLNVVTPLLLDNRVDFELKDSNQGSSLLHNLFGRITTRYQVLPQETVHTLFKNLYRNPAFKKEYLYIKNNFKATPLDCLKQDAKEYVEYWENMDKVLFADQLNNELEENESVARHKI